MAGSGRRIVIEFLGKDVSAGSAAAEVEKKFGKFGGTLDKIGQRAGASLALAGAGLAAFAVSAGKAAAEDEAAAARLANLMQNSAGASDAQVAATERWITAQGKALGVSDDQLRPALGRLVTATGDVGKAQDLAALAMDVSAGSGKSLEAVSTALAKAQNGNVGALGRLGVATKDAEGKTLSLSEITQQLADKYSGAASTAADTTAGKQQRLAVRYAELREEIGTKLLPVMEKIVAIGDKVIAWVDEHQRLTGILVLSVGGLAATLYAVSLAMRAATIAATIWKAAVIVARNVQLAWNLAMMANPIGLIVLAIVGLIAILVLAYQHSETFRNIIDGAFRAVQAAAQFVWDWIKSNWPLLLAILTGPIGLAVLFITKHWDEIKAGVSAVVTWITTKWDAIVAWFKAAPGKIASATAGMWDGIKDAFRGALNWLIDKWNGLSFGVKGFEFHGLKIPGVTVSTPDIPRLASGGIIRARRGGILANIGEGRHDEAVIPLNDRRAAAALGGGGDTYIFNLYGIVDSDGQKIISVISKHLRETGMKPAWV